MGKPPPSGKPMTLVAAMIHVAVTGLYTSAIADGLAWHGWREPQLLALQEQLKEINLLSDARRAFRGGTGRDVSHPGNHYAGADG